MNYSSHFRFENIFLALLFFWALTLLFGYVDLVDEIFEVNVDAVDILQQLAAIHFVCTLGVPPFCLQNV